MSTLTYLHVLISLVGIGSGFIVVGGLFAGQRLNAWTAIFLASNFATSASGFLFPSDRVLPAHAIGLVALVLLTVAAIARYAYRLFGGWRSAYVAGTVGALYLNVFVLVVQLFQKVPALQALAPTQSEPVFAVTQLAVLVAFLLLGVASGRRFGESEASALTSLLNRVAD
ncbi:MAG: hypothetical protein JNG89_08695 [Planctomycetaceae bacterium]|nr:hypothetical protein [Planctomycetaceae bacterium]